MRILLRFYEIFASPLSKNSYIYEILTPYIGVPATGIVMFIAYIEFPASCKEVAATGNEVPHTILGVDYTDICIDLLLLA
ncbi:MAG: hypothetical protein NT166_16930 [Candidatus Aminicenantes bacterium]|nr:hypothetical protein [Candidatus Aminicenantes bacterium]